MRRSRSWRSYRLRSFEAGGKIAQGSKLKAEKIEESGKKSEVGRGKRAESSKLKAESGKDSRQE